MESNSKIKNQHKAIKIISIIMALLLFIWLSATYYTGKILEKNKGKLTDNLSNIEQIIVNYLENQ